ncbi:hypothetical protein ACLOJK_022050 [Asimina triloba]
MRSQEAEGLPPDLRLPSAAATVPSSPLLPTVGWAGDWRRKGVWRRISTLTLWIVSACSLSSLPAINVVSACSRSRFCCLGGSACNLAKSIFSCSSDIGSRFLL